MIERSGCDATSGTIDEIPKTSIESMFDVGSLMPDGLLKTLSPTNRRDLIRLLTDLGRYEEISAEQIDSLLKQAHAGVPVAFAFQRDPLEPANWPSWKLPVNRDRIYDYYSKQARFFRGVCPAPVLLPEFPGLDGGTLGHWETKMKNRGRAITGIKQCWDQFSVAYCGDSERRFHLRCLRTTWGGLFCLL